MASNPKQVNAFINYLNTLNAAYQLAEIGQITVACCLAIEEASKKKITAEETLEVLYTGLSEVIQRAREEQAPWNEEMN